MILAESGDQVSLPYPTVPDYDYFDRVHVSFSSLHFLEYYMYGFDISSFLF